MEKREPQEIAIQSSAFRRLWNERPELRGRVFAINNNSQNAIKGAMNKAMGVLPGVSDMAYICPIGRIIWIEWKTVSGRQSNDQKLWQASVTGLGHTYVIVHSYEEFISVIDQYSANNA